MKTWLTACFTLAAVAALAPSSAHACTTALEYAPEIVSSDLPECASAEPGASFDEAIILVTNDCADELTLTGMDCASCEESTTLRPGASMSPVVVQTSPEEGQVTLTWSAGDQQGQLVVGTPLVSGDDEESSCGAAGCQLGAPQGSAGLVGLVLLGLGGLGRRRRV